MPHRFPPDPRPLAPLTPELPPLTDWPTVDAAAAEAVRRFTTPPPTTRRNNSGPDRGQLPSWMRVADDFSLVETAHGAVAAWRWGAADAPALACMHGWGGRTAQWAPVIEGALAAGWQVVACDAPGHGASDGSDAAMPAFRDALLAAVDAFAAPLQAMAGHSLGGLAVLAAATAWRERRTADAGGARRVAADGDALRIVSIGAPATVARPFARFVARHRATDAIRDAMLARFAARWHVDFHELETDVIAARCAATGPMPPLLVLHATDDEQVPVAEAGYLASLWPGATLQLVPHGGHSSLLRDPDVVQRVVRFIAP